MVSLTQQRTSAGLFQLEKQKVKSPPTFDSKVSGTTRTIENANEYMIGKINKIVQEADEASVADAPNEYPVIDIRSWVQPCTSTRLEKEEVVRQVLKHACESGSFNIVGHEVTSELMERLDTTARDFFALPLEEKRAYFNGNNFAGYVAIEEESNAAVYGKTAHDQRQIYSAVYPPDSPINVQAPAAFQQAISDYMRHMHCVDIVLHEIFTAALNLAKGLDLPLDYLESAKCGSSGLLRCSHYPQLEPDYPETKLGAHSDWGTLTIITSSAKGLEEVRNGRWVSVPVNSGELHVMVGETLHIWSNGLFANNIHRVSKDAPGDRTSYGYFAPEGEDGINDHGIKPIVEHGESPLFPPVSARSHVDNYCKTLFQKE